MGNPNGNPMSKRFSITKRQKLLSEVYKYAVIRKWTSKEIAEALDIPWSTIRLYVRVVKNAQLKRIQENEPDFYGLDSWIASTVENFDTIIKQAWNEYQKAVTPKERMVCLDRVHAAEKEKFTILQSMGVAPKAQEKERMNEKITYISKLKGEDVKDEKTIADIVPEESRIEL